MKKKFVFVYYPLSPKQKARDPRTQYIGYSESG